MSDAAGNDAGWDDAGISDAGGKDAGSNDGGGNDGGANDAGNDGGDAPMTFFVTSVGNGASGGNYGGLSGADARCQALAAAVGQGGRTWHAYLSTAPVNSVGTLVNARDRIGAGPWHNYRGELIASTVSALHANPPSHSLMLSESGASIPSNEHDIVTGSNELGYALNEFPGTSGSPPPTCGNWTSNSADDYGYVGHEDWDNGITFPSWNSAHETECDQAGLTSHAGTARLYCFAVD